MKIVSFTGPKGSGKDTSADILKDNKIAAGSISFAGPLKKICCEVFKLHHNLVNDPILKEKPLEQPIVLKAAHFRKINLLLTDYLSQDEFFYTPHSTSIAGLEGIELKTPREILQFIGTEYIRNRVHPDWHLRAAFSNSTLAKLDENGVYCVTDARFPNEYTFLAEKFGEDFMGFYVERPEAEEKLAVSTHDSERQVLEVKKLIPEENIIKNDKTLKDLEKQLLAKDFSVKEGKKKGKAGGKFKFVQAGKNDEGSF